MSEQHTEEPQHISKNDLDDIDTNKQTDDNINKISEDNEKQKIHEIESFDELIDFADKHTSRPFNENILRGIYNYGYEKPSKIQSLSITPMILGNDMIAQAPSGTGKTAAFTIGTLYHIDPENKNVQAIIIAPTRELACQINCVVAAISQHMNIKTCLCIGGISTTKDNIQKLREGCHIVVGTPGRLNDLIKREALMTTYVKIIVMDEVDELLRDTFVFQIQSIIKSIDNDTAYICLFSATLSQHSLNVTQNFLRDPVNILVEKEKLSLEGIKQYYVDVVYDDYKLSVLCDLYKHLLIAQSIVFVNSKEKSIEVAENFTSNDYNVAVINGSMTSEERENVMKRFRQGDCRVLIATDIISRGIDVQQVNVVINYDIPRIDNKESYLHRIGRSGRYGRKGLAINFVTKKSENALNTIYRYYNIKKEALPQNVSELS